MKEQRKNQAVVDFLISKCGLEEGELKHQSSHEYLKFLLNCPADSLNEQPGILEKEHDLLLKSKKDTVRREYKSFVAAHNHLEELNLKSEKIPTKIEALEKHIPKLLKKAAQCERTFANGVNARVTNTVIANQFEHLLPILEIPMLFDTLIRNSHYEEAMDLQLFTQRLPTRYPDIPLLKELAKIRNSSQAMLNQLFGMLRGPARLPLCIRVVGYLRRLGFLDSSLRVLFLNLRYEYLKNLLELIKEPFKQDYLRRWIETHREHFFDIMTHYKAIFPDASTTKSGDRLILPTFVMHAILHLMSIVQDFLDGTDDISQLPSLNTQIMYYGMSLGRAGIDFRPLFVEKFEETVFRITSTYFAQANNEFILNSTRVERPLINAQPNEMLLKCTPLAVSYNHFMNGLNNLRYLPCQRIAPRLSETLRSNLSKMIDKIIDFNMISKRDAEIVAWIMHDCIVGLVCEGLDSVLGNCHRTEFHDLLLRLQPLMLLGKPAPGALTSPVTTVLEITVEDATTNGDNTASLESEQASNHNLENEMPVQNGH